MLIKTYYMPKYMTNLIKNNMIFKVKQKWKLVVQSGETRN